MIYIVGIGVVILGVIWIGVRYAIRREDRRVKNMSQEEYRAYQNEMRTKKL